LLEAYDRANRLEIDSVYAQFSPTLDDFYLEELVVIFPAPPGSSLPDDVRPEIVLTRTVPGQQPRSVRAPGAAFPLSEATRLAHAALAETRAESAEVTLSRLRQGLLRLWPVQLPRTQLVQLRVLPDGGDVLALLATPAASAR